MATPYVVLNSVQANATGTPVYCKDFKHILVTVSTNGLTTGESFKLNFQVSAEEANPDFSAAKSQTNLWDYVAALKLSDGTIVDGVTGDSFSANDDTRIYEINTNGATWFNMTLGSLVGTVTVLGKAMLYNEHNE